jgi:hypothetical protein
MRGTNRLVENPQSCVSFKKVAMQVTLPPSLTRRPLSCKIQECRRDALLSSLCSDPARSTPHHTCVFTAQRTGSNHACAFRRRAASSLVQRSTVSTIPCSKSRKVLPKKKGVKGREREKRGYGDCSCVMATTLVLGYTRSGVNLGGFMG